MLKPAASLTLTTSCHAEHALVHVHTMQWPEQVKSASIVLYTPVVAMQPRKMSGRSSASLRPVRSSTSAFWKQPVVPVGSNKHLEHFKCAGSPHHMAIIRLHRFFAMEFGKSGKVPSGKALPACPTATTQTILIENNRKIDTDFFQRKNYKKGSNAWHRYGHW